MHPSPAEYKPAEVMHSQEHDGAKPNSSCTEVSLLLCYRRGVAKVLHKNCQKYWLGNFKYTFLWKGGWGK